MSRTTPAELAAHLTVADLVHHFPIHTKSQTAPHTFNVYCLCGFVTREVPDISQAILDWARHVEEETKEEATPGAAMAARGEGL